MKYIRTKDGKIIEYQSDFYKTGVVCCKDEFVFKEEIINQADTIKELCDEFFIDYGKERFPYSTYRQHERYAGYGDLMRYLREIYFTGYDGVYGYIWVGNELKLVAKMNEKGELELL